MRARNREVQRVLLSNVAFGVSWDEVYDVVNSTTLLWALL